jgi:hypothetical protein
VIENKSPVQPIITISTVNYTHIFTMTTVKEKDYDGRLKVPLRRLRAEEQGSRSRSRK